MEVGVMSVPPGGWVYGQKLPNGNLWYIHKESRDSLIAAIRQLRINLNLSIETLEQEIDSYFDARKPKPVTSEISLRERVTGWKAQREFKQHDFVDQSEAERRSEICSACPFNVLRYADSCIECYSKVEHDLFALRQGRTTSKDQVLGACDICAHQNATAVHLADKSLLHRVNYLDKLEKKRPQCWLLSLHNNPSVEDSSK